MERKLTSQAVEPAVCFGIKTLYIAPCEQCPPGPLVEYACSSGWHASQRVANGLQCSSCPRHWRSSRSNMDLWRCESVKRRELASLSNPELQDS